MKRLHLIAKLLLCLSFVKFSQAAIEEITFIGYFDKLTAHNTSRTRSLEEFDSACKEKYGYMLNTSFLIEIKRDINDLPEVIVKHNKDSILLNRIDNKNNEYTFQSSELPQSLTNHKIQTIYLTIGSNFHHPNLSVVFNPAKEKVPSCKHPFTCIRHRSVEYQCVLE